MAIKVYVTNPDPGPVKVTVTNPTQQVASVAVSPTLVPGPGVASGGDAGDLLVKQSSTDYDDAWVPASGDVTVAITGEVTIANNAVTFAKMEDIATEHLIGRHSSGSGDPQQVGLDGGLEFQGANIRRSALTGDVTASAGSNATTISNDAVSYAKMQNVSAGSTLLGRGDSGSGDPQEITLGTGLSMTGTTLAVTVTDTGITELTGDVTAGPGNGSQAATFQASAISGKTLLTPLVGTEEVLVNDGGTLKKTTAQDIADLGGGGGIGGSTGATDNAVLRADGTGGSTVQNSTMTIADDGKVVINVSPNTGQALSILGTDRVGYIGNSGYGNGIAVSDIVEITNGNGFTSTSSSGTVGHFMLRGDTDANVASLQNCSSDGKGTNPQTLRIYETYPSTGNYERLAISAASGTNTIKPEAAGTGSASKVDYHLTGSDVRITSGTGSPESAVSAPVGSEYHRTDGGTGTTLYIKESGTGNTGWVAVASGGGTVTSVAVSGTDGIQVDSGSPITTSGTIQLGVDAATMKTTLDLTGTNSGDQNLFGTIAVSGQSSVVADSTSDTLTLVAGSNVTITTDASTDSITIAASGGGGVSDGDKGDITVSSSGTVWTVDNDAITYAKMQNVSAASKLLGRGSASGSGDVEEITIGSGLSLSGTTLSATGGGGGGGGMSYAYLASDVATTDNSTLQDITGLSFAVAANTAYHFEGLVILVTSATATGSQFGWTFPASPTLSVAVVNIHDTPASPDASTTTTTGLISSNASGRATEQPVYIAGTFVNGSNAGTVQFTFKVETGITGTVTAKAGSFLKWQEITT